MANWKPWESIGDAAGWAGGKIGDAWDWASDKEGKDRRDALSDKFAGQGDIGFGDYQRRGAGLDASAGFLADVMRGNRSVSAEQLRQGLGQQLAQQRSMAASARPGNQAMAARTAAIQGNRAASGLMGQQALAGLQERQNAANAYGRIMGQARGQDLQAGLGYGQHAAALQGAYGPEQAAKGGLIGGLASAAGKIFSDVNLKENIQPGDQRVRELMRYMDPKAFDYKEGADPERHFQQRTTTHGTGSMEAAVPLPPERVNEAIAAGLARGRQPSEVGIMAQDLEKSQMGQRMVQNTPQGKTIDGKRLLTGIAAATANLNKRLELLEKAEGETGSARKKVKRGSSSPGSELPEDEDEIR